MKHRTEAHPKRAQALQLLAEGVTPAEVARRLELTPSTVRVWKSRAGVARNPVEPAVTGEPADELMPATDPDASVVQIRTTITEAQSAARLAIQRLHEILPTARGPQAIAVAGGIMVDKARQLEEQLAEQERDRMVMVERDAQRIHSVIKELLQAHGVDASAPAVRTLVRALLTRAAQGDEIAAPREMASEVRRLLHDRVRQEVERELREELRREVAERSDRPALPAPATTDDALRAWQERVRDGEIVDAEVVS